MRQVTELKEIQGLALEILKPISKYCQEKQIAYYLGYGTLLGAIRHNGFIPWDDDIDLWMKRADFNRFCTEFSDWGKKYGLYINSVKTTEKYNRVHAQVCLRNTKLKANDRVNSFEEGYFVDIFPLDGTPNNAFSRWLHMTRLQMLKNMVTLSAYNAENKSAKAFVAKMFRNVDTVGVLRRYEKIAEKYDCEKSKYLQMMAPGRRHGRNILVDAAYFMSTEQIPFEDVNVPAPAGYDDILRGIYGDYMQLPPEEYRKPHHDFVLWKEDRS